MKPGDYTRGRARTDTETLVQMFPELRARAFAVQGIDDYSQLQRIQETIAKLPEGGKWKELRAQIAEELGGDSAATRRRAETILRTNGFQAYGAARYREQQENKEVFPYLKYVAIDDGRARDRHMELDGVILPIDDPFWKDHYPPWDFNCRCIVIQMTEEDAHEEAEQGDGSMWDEATRKTWMANHHDMDEARQYHFRPDTLEMDLRDLAQAEKRTPEDMEAFGELMETRRIGTGEFEPDGTEQTTSVRDWLWQPVRREYHVKAQAGGEVEQLYALDARTGAEVGQVTGTARAVDLGKVVEDAVPKWVVHNHPNGEATLSPADVLGALRPDVEKLEAVTDAGWMRVSVHAKGDAMRRTLREWRQRLAAAKPNEMPALIQEWQKWLETQHRYGYLKLDTGGPLV